SHTAQLKDLLESADEAPRLVGLGLVQGSGEPTVLERVIGICTHPPSYFEQYHALLALESIRPTLPAPELSRLAESLQVIIADLPMDSNRTRIARRLLETITNASELAPSWTGITGA